MILERVAPNDSFVAISRARVGAACQQAGDIGTRDKQHGARECGQHSQQRRDRRIACHPILNLGANRQSLVSVGGGIRSCQVRSNRGKFRPRLRH